MLTNSRLPGARLRAGVVVLGAGLLALLMGAPSAAAVRPVSVNASATVTAVTAAPVTAVTAVPVTAAPQLRIDVGDGRSSAVTGDTMTYTLSVQNLGTTDVNGLLISQSVPAGLVFVSADSKGVAKSATVTWNLDLKVGKTVAFHTTMKVVTTPPELLRLATVACATLPLKSSPIVCASDSDQLPAGAAAAVPAGPVAAAASNAKWWYLGGGTIVVMLAAALAVMMVRRRRVRAAV